MVSSLIFRSSRISLYLSLKTTWLCCAGILLLEGVKCWVTEFNYSSFLGYYLNKNDLWIVLNVYSDGFCAQCLMLWTTFVFPNSISLDHLCSWHCATNSQFEYDILEIFSFSLKYSKESRRNYNEKQI